MAAVGKYQNLYQSLCHSARRAPNALALVYEEQAWSFAYLHNRVKQAMVQLAQGWSLKKGDRLVLAWGNTPAFCELFYAALALGIEVIPFSTKLKQEESAGLLQLIQPAAVFYDSECQAWLAQEAGHCGAGLSLSLAQWRELALPAGKECAAEIKSSDVAVIMFTSGTTGSPKGAVITHGNLLCAVGAYIDALPLTAADRTILAVPIYHITGLAALLALFIQLGGTIYLHRRFNALEIAQAIERHNITFLHGSPTVFVLLCQAVKNANSLQPHSFPSLRAIACGAGHLNQGLIKELTDVFPRTTIHPVYGLTETTSPATLYRGDARDGEKINSSGQPVLGINLAVRDENGNDLPAGEIGHIWLQGSTVITHYWPASPDNNHCFKQGWFYSGDLGYVDKDNYLFVKDRNKDMINRGGEKIYSIELENIISTYPGVNEVAVIPIPSHVYGEEPLAFIVPDGQHCLTSEELLNWLKQKVPRFKLPVQIIFTRTLPRTHNGKISKRQLKEKINAYANWL